MVELLKFVPVLSALPATAARLLALGYWPSGVWYLALCGILLWRLEQELPRRFHPARAAAVPRVGADAAGYMLAKHAVTEPTLLRDSRSEQSTEGVAA